MSKINCVNFRNAIKMGDVIGFSGESWLSAGINLFTYGLPYHGIAHVGIIGQYEGNRTGLYLFHSTMSSSLPCVLCGEKHDGVQVHKLDDVIKEAKGRAWHYPLTSPMEEFYQRRLDWYLHNYHGKEYDAIGAFRSAGVGFSWLESLFRPEDMTSLFCSEYVAGAHKYSSVICKCKSASRWNPNRLVRHERRVGILQKPRRLK